MMNEIKERNEKMITNHTAPQSVLSPKFAFAFNLDDNEDRKEFIEICRINGGVSLEIANAFGFTGKGKVKAVRSLRAYAHNKQAAVAARVSGNISRALTYQQVCDGIYRREILPFIQCW